MALHDKMKPVHRSVVLGSTTMKENRKSAGMPEPMTPTEINQIRCKLGLTIKQLGKLLDINDESTMRQYVAAPTANRYRKPAARMVRLLRAYEVGYRPDDWPKADRAVQKHDEGEK